MNTQNNYENTDNLIIYDISCFIEKYTRFMSKNIYISKHLHDLFFSQYNYLYETLDKEKLLYMNNPKYQKAISFKKNQDKLIRLHNTKYLKKTNQQYQEFFDNLYHKEILDSNKRNAILFTPKCSKQCSHFS